STGTLMDNVIKAIKAGDTPSLQAKTVALKLFNRALEVAPNHPQVHNQIGNLYKTYNEFALAAAQYEKAIQSNPLYAMAYLQLGVMLLNLHRYEESLQALARANDL